MRHRKCLSEPKPVSWHLSPRIKSCSLMIHAPMPLSSITNIFSLPPVSPETRTLKCQSIIARGAHIATDMVIWTQNIENARSVAAFGLVLGMTGAGNAELGTSLGTSSSATRALGHTRRRKRWDRGRPIWHNRASMPGMADADIFVSQKIFGQPAGSLRPHAPLSRDRPHAGKATAQPKPAQDKTFYGTTAPLENCRPLCVPLITLKNTDSSSHENVKHCAAQSPFLDKEIEEAINEISKAQRTWPKDAYSGFKSRALHAAQKLIGPRKNIKSR